jgi:hypothetical protein
MRTRVTWTLLTVLALIWSSLAAVASAQEAQTPTTIEDGSTAAQTPPVLDSPAAAAAVEISQFEAAGDIGQLYARMHLDAKVLIPEQAVAGWFQAEFFPRGPGAITVTGVQMVSWTWEVTGVTYPTTAEVSFTQPFANGETVSEVVRLVEDNGQWYWFFGRNREFVNQQIATYAPGYPPIDDASAASSQIAAGVAPWGLEAFSMLFADPQAFLAQLPPTIVTNQIGGVEVQEEGAAGVPPFATQSAFVTYYIPPELTIPSGQLTVYTVRPGVTAVQALAEIETSWQATPSFAILRQYREPSADVPFMLIEGAVDPAVGVVPVLYWASPDGTMIFAASMPDFVTLRLLVNAIAEPPGVG